MKNKDEFYPFKEAVNQKTYDDSSEEVIYFKKVTISYPLMTEIHKKIHECHKSRYSGNPDCLRILGPSRSGKTRIIEKYQELYPDIEMSEYTKKRVLYSRTPCPAKKGVLAQSLLRALGDRFYDKGKTIGISTFRLIDLLKACEVELLIIDEVQHLVDRDSSKVIRESADWFKMLMEETGIPIIFVGLTEAKKIFTENEQLAGRVMYRFNTSAFEYNKEFRSILFLLDKSLEKINISNSELATPDIAKRIFVASGGLIGYVKMLLIESIKIALGTGCNKLSMDILHKGFENVLTDRFTANPFVHYFNLDSVKSPSEQKKTDDDLGGPSVNRRISSN